MRKQITNYEPVDDHPMIAIDLLSSAEDCYKSLRELGKHGNNISSIRNYIDVLEKELDKYKRIRYAIIRLAADGCDKCHNPANQVSKRVIRRPKSNPPTSDALGWVD
jgi:hypothetical protein